MISAGAMLDGSYDVNPKCAATPVLFWSARAPGPLRDGIYDAAECAWRLASVQEPDIFRPMSNERPSTSAHTPSCLFLSATERETEGSRLYRCAYQAKQLEQAGISAEVAFYQDIKPAIVKHVDVLVFSRCPWSEQTLSLIHTARESGKLVLGDLDDKIFTPWDADETGYLRSMIGTGRDITLRARVASAERNVLRLLPMFDQILASTPGICDELHKLGIRASLARNALDTDVAPPFCHERSTLRRILIMSGTRTHDADIRLLAKPLARFLAEHPSVQCTFLGALTLASTLRGLPNVRTHPLIPVEKLYSFVSEFDLCLVPLEPTTFNDCKSALKFIECGIVSVPVIASPCREYRDILRHGVNGFLASNDEDSWYDTLTQILHTPELLRRVAQGAHHSVLAEHTVSSRGVSLATTIDGLVTNPLPRTATRGSRAHV